MVRVLFTVDTEIWCDGWSDLDERFPSAFNTYVYGPTQKGQYALPGLFRILNEHGLTGVFMVEALFATRFGISPLEELVGLIREAGHEIQLHLHPEWVDEAVEPLVALRGEKTPLLRDFSLEDQRVLIAAGLDLLQRAGASEVTAFRAGSYALNSDTLKALQLNGLQFDTSYNPGYSTGVADVATGCLLTQPHEAHGVIELPITAYRDRGGSSLRHLQLTACSFHEMRHVLERAEAAGYRYVVIVAHNFELLTPDKKRADRIVVRRFEQLCRFLGQNRHRFQVGGFGDVSALPSGQQPPTVAGNRLLTAGRHAEQLARRLL